MRLPRPLWERVWVRVYVVNRHAYSVHVGFYDVRRFCMKNNKGFTLLEVIITIGILSIVMGFFTTFFSNEIRLYFSKDNDIEFKQDARIALDRIVEKVRVNNGLSFAVDSNGNGIIYKGTNILVNSVPNDSNGEINFFINDGAPYGEIRDGGNNRIANYIKQYKLEKTTVTGSDVLIRIIITTGNEKPDNDKKYTTVVRLW